MFRPRSRVCGVRSRCARGRSVLGFLARSIRSQSAKGFPSLPAGVHARGGQGLLRTGVGGGLIPCFVGQLATCYHGSLFKWDPREVVRGSLERSSAESV